MITASVEDLTSQVPRWLALPTITIVRVYDSGIEPVEPNPFRFAVVAVVVGQIAECKALCQGITTSGMKAVANALKAYGVKSLQWRHDGQHHQINFA